MDDATIKDRLHVTNITDVILVARFYLFGKKIKMKTETTLVTALYDIGRGEMKKEANNYRPFTLYLEWFKQLLRLKIPLVIFIPPQGKESGGYNLEEFIKQHRQGGDEYPTQIIICPYHDLPLYKKRDKIKQVMDKLNKKDIRLEFHLPDYIVIIYSKFDFLNQAINRNFFKSKYFFWIDAGYFRRAPGNEVLSPMIDEKVASIKEKFLVQDYNLNLTPLKDEMSYLQGCHNEIIACFMGGSKDVVIDVGKKVQLCLDNMLNHNIVNNEQQALSVVIKREPEKFLLYPYHGDGREIIYDFSSLGQIKIPYTRCNKLKLLTVASREVRSTELKQWIVSAEYYGYDYEILGREDKWGGWSYRTAKYLARLKELKSQEYEVAILCDGTDLFFCGSAHEAYRKYLREGKKIFIGSEPLIAYNNGRNNGYEIEDFFIKQCQARACFPNGGFVIGPISELIKLLEENVNSKDDQAGYMDLLYEKRVNYYLDEKNVFIGNLPNLYVYSKRDGDFWSWDQDCHRYYNPLTREYPIALHFPGGNRDMQNKLFGETFPLNLENKQQNSSCNWIWWLMIIFLLLGILWLFWNFRRC